MSQLNASSAKGRLFWHVSALALVAVAGGARGAKAAGSEGGITLELDGQYDFDRTEASNVVLPTGAIPDPSIHPHRGYDVGGKLTYQPDGSPLSYALGVRYGRTNTTSRSFHGTSYGTYYFSTDSAKAKDFFFNYYDRNVKASHRMTHVIVDFEVGKDVGVGLFGSGVTTVGVGLRYAHFDAVTRGSFSTISKYATNTGQFTITRRTDAIGPRLFVKTTSPFKGSLGMAGFSLGMGGGVGVLYGHQTVHTDVHLSSGFYAPLAKVSLSKNQAVVSLDAYLQLNWTAPNSPLTLSAGYRFDAFSRALFDGLPNSNGYTFMESGPFVSASVKLH